MNEDLAIFSSRYPENLKGKLLWGIFSILAIIALLIIVAGNAFPWSHKRKWTR